MFFLLWITTLIYSVYSGYRYLALGKDFKPVQPITFSHKVHSGDYKMKCLFCHTTAVKSAFSSIPSTYSCMVCHIALRNEKESMKLLNQSYDRNKPIVWKRLYKLPDYTHFNHSRHINASIDCSSCHGEVDRMEVLTQVSELTMQWCLDCHRNPLKYIVKPKEISGIFMDNQIDTAKILASNNYTLPSFGLFLSILPKNLKGFHIIKKPGYGPETCSSCHY